MGTNPREAVAKKGQHGRAAALAMLDAAWEQHRHRAARGDGDASPAGFR